MKSEGALIKILQTQFTLIIDTEYGDDGVNDFKRCLDLLRSLYENITPLCYSTITAFVGDYPFLKGKGKEIKVENIHSENVSNLIIRLVDDETVVLYQSVDVNVVELSSSTFVYHWRSNEKQPDQFYIKGKLHPFVNDVPPPEGSFFAVRTYSDLDEALINYRDNFALMCKGRALIESMTPERLFYNPAPEDLLQEALVEYLDSRLRNCDVKREHNVDDSHPVDIVVKWRGTNHMALIEIKWVGKSLNKEGNVGVKYYDKRANEGAAQLAGYIDNNSDSFPRDITIGYLVVFDLRRHKNDDVNKVKMSRVNADYYNGKEINYNPQYDLVRKDFRKPYRFFIKVRNDVYED